LDWYTSFPGLVHKCSWTSTLVFLDWYTSDLGLVH
jgi:hypothetical protein